MKRRDFLRTAGVAAAAAAGVRLSPLAIARAQATMLDLYHDKSSWVERVDQVGQLAADSIGVGFKSVASPDTTNYQATVRAALGSSRPPDLLSYWSGFRMEDLVQDNFVEDLTAIWEPYLANGTYNPGVAAAFSFDNKIYAVPFNVSYWIVYYNKKLFDDNGFAIPTTWDELTALCDAMVAKGITPLAQTISDRWQAFIVFEEMVARTAGPDFWNGLMTGANAYNDPKVLDALAVWKDMIDKGYFTDPGISMGTTSNDVLPLFNQGKVAMLPIGEWYSAALIEAGLEPGTDYDAFILPNYNPDLPNVLFFEAGPMLVSANGARKGQALQVAEWWMTAEAQQAWCSLMDFSTPNAEVTLENPVSNHIAQMIADGKYLAMQRYWEATPPAIVEVAVDELSRFMLEPDKAQVALDAIQQTADSVWKERGK